MFDYTHKETHTSTKSTKDIAISNANRIPVCQAQDIRTTSKHFTASNTLQRKATAEYLNPIPSSQARHHIIPDSILKNFIAKVKTNNPPIFQELITAVEESYIQYHHITQDELNNPALLNFDYIRKLPNNPKNKFLSLITYTKTNAYSDYCNDMAQAFIWSPGNLVIGPRERGVDPGNEYDSKAASIAGIPLGTPRNLDTKTEPTGQMRLGEVLSMMLYYIDGTINQIDENIIRNMLIPHIKRELFDGTGSTWK